MANGSRGPHGPHHHWWDNAIPLAIVAAGVMGQAQAPLDHGRFALGGFLLCAIAARIVFYMWRRTGVEHFTERFTETLKRK
jgi:hypothetical protein